jgi:hypothetical protein
VEVEKDADLGSTEECSAPQVFENVKNICRFATGFPEPCFTFDVFETLEHPSVCGLEVADDERKRGITAVAIGSHLVSPFCFAV